MTTLKKFNDATGQWEYVLAGPRGIQGEKGDKGDPGNNGSAVIPITNQKTNGNLATGDTTGWLFSNATGVVSNGALQVLPTAAPSSASTTQHAYQTVSLVTGNKYYGRARVKGAITVKLQVTNAIFGTVSTPDSWQTISGVYTSTVTATRAFGLRDTAASNWTTSEIDDAIWIDLTTTFGAGKEPTAAEMDYIVDTYYAGYISGTIQMPIQEYLETRYPRGATNTVVPVIATNLIPSPAPWTANGWTTVIGSLVDDTDSVRGKAFECTTTALSQIVVQTPSVVLTEDMKNRSLTVSVDAKIISTPSSNPLLRFTVWQSGPNFTTSSGFYSVSTTRGRYSFTLPTLSPNTTSVYVRVAVWGTNTIGTIIRLSGFSIGTEDYLDGETVGARWTGSVRASASERMFHSGSSDAAAARAAASALPAIKNYSEGVGSPEGVVDAPVGTRYVDTVATNGAVEWTKMSGTGNTGWKVTTGDTGVRWLVKHDATGTVTYGSYPPNTTPNTVAGGFAVRRINDTVYWYFMNVTINNTSTQEFVLPVGFRDATGTYRVLDVWASANRIQTRRSGPYVWLNATAVPLSIPSYPHGLEGYTTDAWPTTLPGVV